MTPEVFCYSFVVICVAYCSVAFFSKLHDKSKVEQELRDLKKRDSYGKALLKEADASVDFWFEKCKEYQRQTAEYQRQMAAEQKSLQNTRQEEPKQEEFVVEELPDGKTIVTLMLRGVSVASWVSHCPEEPKNVLVGACKCYSGEHVAGLQLKDIRLVKSQNPGEAVFLEAGGDVLAHWSEHSTGDPSCGAERICQDELNRWRRELGMEEV